MFGRNTLVVKLPREMLDEARATVAGAGLKPDGRNTVARGVGFLLELYLVNHPDVTFYPSPRGRTKEPPEAQVTISVSEGLADLLDTFMAEERQRLEVKWRNTPRRLRDGKRPPKPEYRGLVIAAIKEGTHTNCFGCK